MPDKFFQIFISVIEITFFVYFFYVSFYNIFLSLSGLIQSKKELQKSDNLRSYAVLIPAYKEDSVILNTVEKLLEVNYPRNLLKIIVIADSFQENTLQRLNKYPITVHEVSFTESTKVKAIQSVLNTLKLKAELLVIIDADNFVENNFFASINSAFDLGFELVQSKRVIKNPGNSLALLDDLSEQINTHINRKGACSLGGSASIAGSGFAVESQLGIEIFRNLDSVGGFDKEFEILALRKGIKTQYIDSAIVFDEKVETNEIFRIQRTRWIASQYAFLKKYFKEGIKAFSEGNFSLFNSIILRNVQLPRLINVGLFTILIIVVSYFYNTLLIRSSIWIIVYLLFIISIVLAIPKRFYNYKTVVSIFRLPGIFITMLSIMFKLKGANRVFLHTPHNVNLNTEDD